MRRGRKDPDHLRVGEAVDFWLVERIDPGRRLLLAAEMKLPGRLWLQFEVKANGHRTAIRQTTVFDPAGYVGLAYWYVLYPVHHTIFAAMLHGLHRHPTAGDTTHRAEPLTRCRRREGWRLWGALYMSLKTDT